jgi:transcription antitermination protein NusB
MATSAAPSGRRPSGAASHQSREKALRILFLADLRGLDVRNVLAEVSRAPRDWAILDGETDTSSVTGEIDERTRLMVEGVAAQRSTIDEHIARHARGWRIHRMPAVDRTILRLATFELLDGSTSPAVVINEAIEFAKAWSTADSGRYVNGVLESVRKSIASESVQVRGTDQTT